MIDIRKRSGNRGEECDFCEDAKRHLDEVMVENGRLRAKIIDLKRELGRGYIGSDDRPLARPNDDVQLTLFYQRPNGTADEL